MSNGVLSKLQIGDLVGRTVKAVITSRRRVIIQTTDDLVWTWSHEQDCCEEVWVDSIAGDPHSMVGQVVTVAREVVSDAREPARWQTFDDDAEWPAESQTWTFYTFATIRGHVDVRWCGESNGYYSETVELEVTA
jgi:hypothetical protein